MDASRCKIHSRSHGTVVPDNDFPFILWKDHNHRSTVAVDAHHNVTGPDVVLRIGLSA